MLDYDLAEDREGARPAIGLFGHQTFCYDDLTVRENLRFAAKAVRKPVEAADAALERVGLRAQAGVEHARLSAGQRRRLALAVALAREPRLLLLDEPHAGLDAEGREVLDAVVRAAPANGCTVLLASHELDIGRALAGREAVVAGGRIVRGGLLTGAPPASAGLAEVGVAVNLWREVWLVAGKDLRIEMRSRVVLYQILPFGALVLLLFAFALDPSRGPTAARRARPVLGRGAARGAAGGLPVVRHRAAERRSRRPPHVRARRQRDVPRQVHGHRRSSCSCSRWCSAWVWSCSTTSRSGRSALLVLSALAATAGVAATGTLYGVLAAGLRVRETLVPVLLLPVVAPVMLGATRAWEAGARRGRRPTGGRGSVCSRCSRRCTRGSGCWPSVRSWRSHEASDDRRGR